MDFLDIVTLNVVQLFHFVETGSKKDMKLVTMEIQTITMAVAIAVLQKPIIVQEQDFPYIQHPSILENM